VSHILTEITNQVANREASLNREILREQDSLNEALASLTKAQEDLEVAKRAAKPTKPSPKIDTPFKKKDGTLIKDKFEKADHSKRIEVSTLFTREQ